ncbi:hypothetical protein JEY39_27370 [Pseudomonas aeruginosa]|nr:hypothetical protein [Pseudomonas aeruginosa]NDZ06939.1 hypothetical protein [Pseudomonas aeruginosa]QIB86726.1 hypothetical protein G3I75_10230 [Pseudomonas aeruginosa]QVJ06975.1 hypothetical protein KGZ78_11235 [Pseudomonas aeruginosa]
MEAGIEMTGRDVLAGPPAVGGKIDALRATAQSRNLQAQFETRADQHRQLADQQQAVLGDVADVAHRLIGDAIEHLQVAGQLMALDMSLKTHNGISL